MSTEWLGLPVRIAGVAGATALTFFFIPRNIGKTRRSDD